MQSTRELEKRVRRYLNDNQMLQEGDVICIGISGGADSVCLLHMLERFSRQSGDDVFPSFTLMALHVNHQLRGEESDADERFVRELCHLWKIPLVVLRFPVADLAEQHGVGLEEAGRMVRQEAFRDCLINHGATKIALAHQANDQAETFLFHAARGTSIGGLAAIRPVQQFEAASVIRPLLCLERTEIETWLTENGYSWRNDATNAEDTYIRNGIRHHVITYIEEHVNAQAVRHMADIAGDLAEADAFLKKETEKRAERLLESGEDPKSLRIREELIREEPFIQGRILLDAMEKISGRRKDLGRMQVQQLQRLFFLPVGSKTDLPYTMQAVREYAGVRLDRKDTAGSDEASKRVCAATEISVSGNGSCIWESWEFTWRVLPATEEIRPDTIPEKQYTKWLDYDKIRQNLVLRSRRKGDYLIVNTDGGKQKLKEYLINQKIPRDMRDQIPMLASGSEIWWVIGGRISETAKITRRTRWILEIKAFRI